LISPTPLVGPDRVGKGDNHANKKFAHEGKQLREFIGKQKNIFICCGWSNKNRSLMHQYLNVVGGFLSVTVESGERPVAIFRHYSTDGKILNEDRQAAR
jgi:alkaline phosphatase D